MEAGEPGRHPDLVGRDTELAQLDRILKDSKAGRGRLVIITGATGVGKTALVQGFLQRLQAADEGAVTLETQCLEFQSAHRPYGPFRDLLARLVGMAAQTGLPSLVKKEAPAWLPGARQSSARNALFHQYVNVCKAVTSQRTLAVLIDDLQWLDRSSLDLLANLAAACASLPIIILGTFEEGTSESAVSIRGVKHRAGANATELAVRGLESQAIGELAEGALAGSLAGDLADWIVAAAKGNPMRAQQFSRWLVEGGLVRKRLFRYSVRAGRLPDPDTRMSQVIAGRLETVEPNIRWTLEAAALAGMVIDSSVVAAQVGKKEHEVRAQLRSAESGTGLIAGLGERRWASGAHSVRFGFVHPLVRQVFQSRVSGKRRENLLTRAAETLSHLAGEGAADIADEIAALYLSSGNEQKIGEWVVRAADLAERLYAPYELEEFLRTAARSADGEMEQLRARYRLASLYGATRREPEAEQLLKAVFERSQKLEEREMQVTAGTMLGGLQLERGAEPFQVSGLAGQLVGAARESGEPKLLVMALDLSCIVAERIGRAEEALLMAEEAHHVAKASGDSEVQALAAYRLARVHLSWGDPEDGRSLAESSLELFTRMDAATGIAECHDLLGTANFRAGNWDGALHHWESAAEHMESDTASAQKIVMQANIAELATLRGQFERARELFELGLEAAEDMEDQALVLRCRTGIARLEFERGDYAAVLVLTEQIRDLLPETGAWRVNFQATTIRALAYLELGDEVQAWQEAVRLEQLYQGKEGWFERRAEGDAVRIRVIELDDDAWLAGMVAQQGIGETTEKDAYGEAFLQYHQGCVLSRAKPDEARAAAERAVELFEKLGAAPMLGRARQLLSELPGDSAEIQSASNGDMDEEKIDDWFDSLEG